MAESSSQSPFPVFLSSERNGAARTDIEWERVMVQITFAFVIILGYLISVGMTEAQNLASETEAYRRQNAKLQSIVSDLGSSEVGKERRGRVAAERKLQLQMLLSSWYKIRSDQPLFELVTYFKVEGFDLSEELPCLPSESEFQTMNREIDRVFLEGSEKISSTEITNLMDLVLKDAGLKQSPLPEPDRGISVPPDIEGLYFDQDLVTDENVRTLKAHILGDLTDKRKDLVEIQFDLVEEISDARLHALANLPLDFDSAESVDAPTTGREMLERIISELKSEVRLLPETVLRIRGDGEMDSKTERE